MKLSDFKGEEALDVLADIIEPIAMIMADEEIVKLQKESDKILEESNGKRKLPMIKFVKPAIKNHKKEVLYVLARLENKSVEEYEKEVTLITLPMKVLEVINDEQLKSLFHSQGQITPLASSGSATENTEADEK